MSMTEVNGFGLLDLMATIKRRQNRYLALILNDLEEYLLNVEDESDEFLESPETLEHRQEVFERSRKYILDTFNDYTRSVFSVLLGEDIENLNFR